MQGTGCTVLQGREINTVLKEASVSWGGMFNAPLQLSPGWLAVLRLVPPSHSLTKAQQFEGYTFPFERLGLSDNCFAAVNTTVSSCPAWLPRYIGIQQSSVDILTGDLLATLCETSCQDDLNTLRKSIESACTQTTDVMVPQRIAYPPTYLVDRFLYASSLSCLRDESTGEYCDIVVADWVNQANYTDDQLCSYCQLGLQQVQLSSPFGYNEVFAEIFANTTASCGESAYSFATPTAYALNSTTRSSVKPTCTGSSYTIQEDDTCVTISGVSSVSTFRLIQQNALTMGCYNLPDVGEAFVEYNSGPTHSLESNDQLSMFEFSLMESSPSGTVSVNAGNAVTTAAAVPTDAQPQSNTYCAEWYYVQSGDYCASISLKFSISLSDFYFMNPQVDENCSNLWANTSYCIAAVGNIQTYSGYVTTTAATTYTKTSRLIDYTATPVEPAPQKPTASGTISGCYLYENAWDLTSRLSNLDQKNACDRWADMFEVTVDYLLEWNPNLSKDNCVLQSGYSYCVRLWEVAPNTTLPYDYCITPNITRIPATSTQPGNCGCYTQFREIDKVNFNCSMIPDILDMTTEELASLNPWIDVDDCDTSIWSQLTDDGYEQICVMGDTADNGSTTTVPVTPTSTAVITTTSAATSAPTQPGTAEDCKKYHTVVNGDGCWAIATDNGLTLDEFYALNPGVGSDCSALWLGYAVCVAN
ncbi:hypothetical protein JX266_012995 [Neoarthrinium moseri]|nr:hypothetical protein JX266_012995 [Neoarthrinium moseri]